MWCGCVVVCIVGWLVVCYVDISRGRWVWGEMRLDLYLVLMCVFLLFCVRVMIFVVIVLCIVCCVCVFVCLVRRGGRNIVLYASTRRDSIVKSLIMLLCICMMMGWLVCLGDICWLLDIFYMGCWCRCWIRESVASFACKTWSVGNFRLFYLFCCFEICFWFYLFCCCIWVCWLFVKFYFVWDWCDWVCSREWNRLFFLALRVRASRWILCIVCVICW